MRKLTLKKPKTNDSLRDGFVSRLPPTSEPVQRTNSEKKGSISRGFDIFTSDATYDEQYESARSFRLQEFKEFEPMEDAVSNSGSERRFQHASKSPSSTDVMSAYKSQLKATQTSLEDKKYSSRIFSYGAYDELSDARSQCSMRLSLGECIKDGKKISPRRIPERQRLDSFGDKSKNEDDDSSISSSPSLQVYDDRGSMAIRRVEDPSESTTHLALTKQTSSFTMRLNDLKILRLTDIDEK